MNKRFNHILCGVALLLLAGCWSLFFQFRYKSPDQPFSDEPIIPELAVPNVIVPPIAEAPPKIHLASMPGQKPDRNLAYAFYATEHGYACSVLVNMHILKNRLKTKVPFVWLVTEKVPEIYATIARDKFGADVRTVTTLDPPPGAWDKYKEVMTKFQIFKLFEFDRLIVLDSDILVQKNLDHLFYLPSVDLALPRANWLSDTFLTSAMFVAEPSEKLWNRIEKRLSNLGNAEFDMDLINSEFLGEALVLPGNYLALDTSLDNTGAEVPKWSRFKGQPDRFKLMWENEIMVVHFSALLDNAWLTPVEQARRARPCATSYFLDNFKDWWTIANDTCPDWKTSEHPLTNFDEPAKDIICGT